MEEGELEILIDNIGSLGSKVVCMKGEDLRRAGRGGAVRLPVDDEEGRKRVLDTNISKD